MTLRWFYVAFVAIIIIVILLTSCTTDSSVDSEQIHRLETEGCCTPDDLLFIEEQISIADEETASYLEAAVTAHELGEDDGVKEMIALAHESAHKHEGHK